jgi:2-methylcitrate dehydratase PrpD
MTLTENLIDLIESKPITEQDLETAALFVLDAVANAIAGKATPPGEKLRRWGRANGADAGRQALLLGAFAHILETDDLHRASVVHPGCVVVPAAWTVAKREGATGRALLRATLKGFEAACRVGMAVGAGHYRIWHNTATCGPYGSAYAAGSLLGLEPPALADALGNAGSQSAGFWQFLETGAMTKHLHAGRASEAGVVAADLAALGFTGPPAILEGSKGFFAATCPDPEPAAVLRAPDAPWQLAQTSIKPWPSCRHTHPAIDAARGLRSTVKPERIAKIEVETYPAALDVCDRPHPTTDYEAKFSLQHTVAASLALEAMDFDAFGDAARNKLAPLRAKVYCRIGEPYAAAFPTAWGSAVTLTLTDGRRARATREHAKGDPEAPLSRREMLDKARMLLRFGGIREPDAIEQSILALAGDAALPAIESGSVVCVTSARNTKPPESR